MYPAIDKPITPSVITSSNFIRGKYVSLNGRPFITAANLDIPYDKPTTNAVNNKLSKEYFTVVNILFILNFLNKNIIEIKNGFSLGLGFSPDKELKKSVHVDNTPIRDETGSRYGKISEKLAKRQSINISNSPVIDFDNIKRNRVFD